MGINYPTLVHFRHFSQYRHSFNYNIFPFAPYLKKQTQCQVGQNQPKYFYNKHLGICGSIGNSENKPNSKPIQTQFNPKQTQFYPQKE
jgi:hypothetical protein